MTKEELEYGNVVETREGIKYLYHYQNRYKFLNLKESGFLDLNEFNENLKIYWGDDCEHDIMKVYKDYTCKELIWERKETPRLTENEKVILRNIDKKFKYITRDKNGRLYVWRHEPIKKCDEFWTDGNGRDFCFDHLFLFIKWEDEKPYKIEDLLKEGDEE